MSEENPTAGDVLEEDSHYGSPYDYLFDVSGVTGYSFLISRPSDDGGTQGMLIRRLIVSGKKNQVMDVQVTLTDLIFLARAIAEYVTDDIDLIERTGGFKLVLSQKVKGQMSEDLRAMATLLSRAADALGAPLGDTSPPTAPS